MPNHIRGVHHGALWTLNLDIIPDFESREVLADVAGGVGFDEQVEGAGLVVPGNWSIRAHDFLCGGDAFAVGDGQGCCDRDVLADWEAEDGGWSWEGEAVAGGSLVAVLSCVARCGWEGTYIATLWEITVFSTILNS